jgi:hypothetical protein
MKKNLISLILALVWVSSTALHAVSKQETSQESSTSNYVPRYDRGYLGNNYNYRISVLHGAEQNTGGVPY